MTIPDNPHYWERAAHALRDAGAALFNEEDNAQVRWIAATLLYEEARDRDQMIDPPACQDAIDRPGWTCVMYDGTGLWCDACLAWAAFHNGSAGTS